MIYEEIKKIKLSINILIKIDQTYELNQKDY